MRLNGSRSPRLFSTLLSILVLLEASKSADGNETKAGEENNATATKEVVVKEAKQRSWVDIVPSGDVFTVDKRKNRVNDEIDAFFFTPAPSLEPSSKPSLSPSGEPSSSPSDEPSFAPSVSFAPSSTPSAEPSLLPSAEPTLEPSSAPSSSPTQQPSSSPSVSPTEVPSSSPSVQPTGAPSSSPTERPSSSPSAPPSEVPSASPTDRPSFLPTTERPSSTPTLSTAPTRAPIYIPLRHPRPPSPYPGYFNYDPRPEAQFGPGQRYDFEWFWSNTGQNATFPWWRFVNNGWENIDAEDTKEYDTYIGKEEYYIENYAKIDQNYCGAWERLPAQAHVQSPIDISTINWNCSEHHEIRERPGDFRINDTEVLKEILPSKLRINYPDRTGEEPDPPNADIPHGWQKQMDVNHIDIKFPSEHTINGTRFAGEYQVYIVSTKTQRGVAVVSILIDENPLDKPNNHFQKAIDAFQKVYDQNKAKCEAKKNNVWSWWSKNRGNRLLFTDPIPTDGPVDKDPLTSPGQWDPMHPKFIMTSHWFYGYKGSLTEPPCTPFAHWRIIDKPMYLSKAQITQLKNILFSNVDEDCNPTSVHYDNSVARPIQQNTSARVWHCTCHDFLSDKDKVATGRNKCNDDGSIPPPLTQRARN